MPKSRKINDKYTKFKKLKLIQIYNRAGLAHC